MNSNLEQHQQRVEQLWNKEAYYEIIKETRAHNEAGNHFFLDAVATQLSRVVKGKVLDVGCGEGSAIEYLSKCGKIVNQFSGIDVADIGIERAKKRAISNAEFFLYDGVHIPFESELFDFSFSTFVFEHLTQPEQVFEEMLRVTKKGGLVCIVCPNYGSPFFRSPCNKESMIFLLCKRLVKGFWPKFFFRKDFGWNVVEPIILPPTEHIADYDTTVEPSLLFFKKHITTRTDVVLVESNSFWSEYVYGGTSTAKKIFLQTFLFLGKMNVPFVREYGPFFYAVVRKK